MRVIPADEEEALSIAVALMPNNMQLEDLDGNWRITRTMEGVWSVWIKDAAKKARDMNHVEPHADTMWYESGETAATAVNMGWHTAYGQVV